MVTSKGVKSCFPILRLNGTIHTKDRKLSLKIRNTLQRLNLLNRNCSNFGPFKCHYFIKNMCSQSLFMLHSVPYLSDNMQIRQPLSQFVYRLRESAFCFNASITKIGMPYCYLFPRLKLAPLGSRVRDHLVPSPPLPTGSQTFNFKTVTIKETQTNNWVG